MALKRGCAVQVFVSPKGMKITRGHLKQALPGRALAAQYEPSTRVLALMFADEEGVAARLGFFSFDGDFMRLQVRSLSLAIPPLGECRFQRYFRT